MVKKSLFFEDLTLSLHCDLDLDRNANFSYATPGHDDAPPLIIPSFVFHTVNSLVIWKINIFWTKVSQAERWTDVQPDSNITFKIKYYK